MVYDPSQAQQDFFSIYYKLYLVTSFGITVWVLQDDNLWNLCIEWCCYRTIYLYMFTNCLWTDTYTFPYPMTHFYFSSDSLLYDMTDELCITTDYGLWTMHSYCGLCFP